MAKIGVTTWLAMASAIAAIAAAGASYFQAHIAREQVELQRKSQRARLKIDGITDILLFRNDSPRILSNIKVSNVGSLPATNITLVSLSVVRTFGTDVVVI